jgi:6,7-dimethyl-8-ribityllumazine synthase
LPRRRRARRGVDVVWVPGAFELPSRPRGGRRRDAIAAWWPWAR